MAGFYTALIDPAPTIRWPGLSPPCTVGGVTLTAKVVDGGVVLTDVAGNTSKVTSTDVAASNGLIHVIDTVLMPK
jgi:uncharacterized surface protein with fasciclin (FAS1) repeats